LRAVPSLQTGTDPNIKDLGRTLKVANENPSKQTAVLFTDNEADPSKVDAIVKVADDKPWKAFITLDNSGSRETEFGRLTFGYQNFNLFDTGQRLTAEFITNTHYPQNWFNQDHKVHVFAFADTIPLTSIGDSIDLLASYSDTTSTEPVSLSGLLGSISGKGLVLGAHYNHNFDNLTNYQHKITVGMDSRNTRASNAVLLGPITPEVTTTPISATYSGQWTPNQQTVAFSAGFSRNIAGLAEHGNEVDFVNSGNANSDFSKLNFSLDYILPLALLIPVAKDWQFHTGFSSQMSWDRLVSIEKFRIGGEDTVRGFHESALSGDEGYRITFEFTSPDFGKFMSENATLRGVLFSDAGRVSDNHDTTGAAGTQTTIASVGAGLRYNYGKNWTGRLDVADVVNGDRENNAGSKTVGQLYGHCSIGFTW
jgi:hemolysin activation/secretion protein